MKIASYVPYIALALTAITLWFPRRYFVAMVAASIVTAWYQGLIAITGIAWLLLLTVLCLLFTRSKGWLRLFFGCCLMVLAVALGMHLLPGFKSMTLIEPVVLSPGAAPFKLQLSPDKILAGLIVAATVWDQYIHSTKEFGVVIRKAAPLIVANIAVLIALSISIGYLNFAPKFTPLFFIWAAHNLLFTCIGEEIFFRGFIQHQLATSFAEMRNGQWLALAISSILFGLVHFGGGTSYVLLAVVAGFGYGYVFMKTQRIEMSMLAHFIMNAMHFLLFAYPRLL